jgi:hypothetical protein
MFLLVVFRLVLLVPRPCPWTTHTIRTPFLKVVFSDFGMTTVILTMVSNQFHVEYLLPDDTIPPFYKTWRFRRSPCLLGDRARDCFRLCLGQQNNVAGKKGSFGWMEISTTAMMIVTAWSLVGLNCSHGFAPCPLLFPTLCRLPKYVSRKDSFRQNNNDELWFGSYRVARHASETEHHGHETMPVSLGTLPRPTQPKQTNERQRCSPPPIRAARHGGITRH